MFDLWFAVFVPVNDTEPITYGKQIVAEVFLSEDDCQQFWRDRLRRSLRHRRAIMPADKYDALTETGVTYMQACRPVTQSIS